MARKPGCWGVLVSVVLAASAVAARADVVTSSYGSLFNPAAAAFAGSTGSLSLTTGSITFNTDTGLISGLPGGDNAAANYYAVSSESGKVALGLFVFDAISLPAGVTINVTGNRGLILASRGDFLLGSTLRLNGGDAPTLTTTNNAGAGGAGAPGSEGGTASNTSTASAPPGPGNGAGGKGGYGRTFGASTLADPGTGVGAGRAGQWGNVARQYGGSSGGYGGAGKRASGVNSEYAGEVYGDAPLANLFGGSGGSGAQQITTLSSGAVPSTSSIGGGGGGGGAVGLISLGTLTLSGSVEARGGSGGGSTRTSGNNLAGGGGSGGGILVAANQILLSGSISAAGGNAGTLAGGTKAEGGGGGGGRVAFYYNALAGSLGSQVSVAGGTSGLSNLNGGAGTVHDAGSGSFPFQPVAGPELSSLTLAALGAAPILLGRKRRTDRPA